MSSETPHKPSLELVGGDDSSQALAQDENSLVEMTVCPQCFGTGVEVVAGKGARPCGCRTRDANRLFFEAAGIPKLYSGCTLESFKEHNNSKLIALKYARALVEDYPHCNKGLLLMGTVGVGKTHLAVAILQGLIRKGVPCLFYETGSLLKRIQDSYSRVSRTSERSVLAPVYETEVLVLDELGSAVWTDWVNDTMYQIINTRYNEKRLTIFTTNYLDEPRRVQHERNETSDEAPPRRRSAAKLTVNWRDQPITEQTLEDRIGTRLRSRLYEMCKKVLMEGEDYRKRSHAELSGYDQPSST